MSKREDDTTIIGLKCIICIRMLAVHKHRKYDVGSLEELQKIIDLYQIKMYCLKHVVIMSKREDDTTIMGLKYRTLHLMLHTRYVFTMWAGVI